MGWDTSNPISYTWDVSRLAAASTQCILPNFTWGTHCGQYDVTYSLPTIFHTELFALEYTSQT